MGLFNLFRNANQLTKMIKAGGNFTFIALNMVTIYSVIEKHPKSCQMNTKQKLALTSMCDMYQYIFDGDTNANEVVGYTKIGTHHTENSSLDCQLTEVTLEIERLIFEISGLASDWDIENQLQLHKEKISQVIKEVLIDSTKSPLYKDVYSNVTRWLNEGSIIDMTMVAIDNVWDER